jgi:hypothetical protein
MGFRPFQGIRAAILNDLPAALLSRAWSMPRLPGASLPRHRVSIGGGWVRPRGSDTPHRVSHLDLPGIGFCLGPGYVFASRVVAHHRAITARFLGRCELAV